MSKIVIIDYGRGNLRSVEKALAFVGYDAVISSDPKVVEQADKLVFPGVGAFGDAMGALERRQLIEPIRESVLEKKVPFLGICLGFQLIFDYSEEGGPVDGLKLLPGKVIRFQIDEKVPHMGWNSISMPRQSILFKGIPQESFVYFVHSYYAVCERESYVTASCQYQIDFTAAVEHENIMATQFHPEKSQQVGLQILKNFGEF